MGGGGWRAALRGLQQTITRYNACRDRCNFILGSSAPRRKSATLEVSGGLGGISGLAALVAWVVLAEAWVDWRRLGGLASGLVV